MAGSGSGWNWVHIAAVAGLFFVVFALNWGIAGAEEVSECEGPARNASCESCLELSKVFEPLILRKAIPRLEFRNNGAENAVYQLIL